METRLVEEKLLEPWQLDMVRLEATNAGISVWAAMVKLGFLSEERICIFFAQECGIPYVRVPDYCIEPQVLHLVEENFCVQNIAIPLFRVQNTLFVACGNPLNTALIDNLSKMTGCTVEPLVSTTHSILSALDLYWRFDERAFELGRFIVRTYGVQGVGQWRESERLAFTVPVSIVVLDQAVTLLVKVPINAETINISADCSAVGIQSAVYLPKGIAVSLQLTARPEGQVSPLFIQAHGEILRSSMLKAGAYLLGVKFINIEEGARKKLADIINQK